MGGKARRGVSSTPSGRRVVVSAPGRWFGWLRGATWTLRGFAVSATLPLTVGVVKGMRILWVAAANPAAGVARQSLGQLLGKWSASLRERPGRGSPPPDRRALPPISTASARGSVRASALGVGWPSSRPEAASPSTSSGGEPRPALVTDRWSEEGPPPGAHASMHNRPRLLNFSFLPPRTALSGVEGSLVEGPPLPSARSAEIDGRSPAATPPHDGSKGRSLPPPGAGAGHRTTGPSPVYRAPPLLTLRLRAGACAERWDDPSTLPGRGSAAVRS